jgi:hypothetical protein
MKSNDEIRNLSTTRFELQALTKCGLGRKHTSISDVAVLRTQSQFPSQLSLYIRPPLCSPTNDSITAFVQVSSEVKHGISQPSHLGISNWQLGVVRSGSN